MIQLEDLQPNAAVRGILPGSLVTVVSVRWFGSEALELTYKTPAGKVANELVYRADESRLEVVEQGRPWSFDGDGGLFRLVSEAHRIRLAHLFDPLLAVHTSLVEPLPHQITAVYEAMLPRQPLRFLLADDPGAGKTIMAGLLIKELIARGDLRRCLVVCPGNLAEQWQDELYRRFQLPFEILTNDKLEAARSGNWFLENHLIIARLDKLSRNQDVQAKLAVPDCRFDLVVCDEAHKLSATFFGGEIKYTKRYRLGQLLSTLTRHFLLMTATPHNGKEEDFQLFMALLDGDRFEGRFRDAVHTVDVSDLMRRMVKERLFKFDCTRLFPERIAHTVPYRLSEPEARLYKEVTEYVREEFNRAEALLDDKRRGTVGFALTILQRRLASSPEAIYQSLCRRRERLENRMRELKLLQRGAAAAALTAAAPVFDTEDFEDLEDAPGEEAEVAEQEILDQATAARTIDELKAESTTLSHRADPQCLPFGARAEPSRTRACLQSGSPCIQQSECLACRKSMSCCRLEFMKTRKSRVATGRTIDEASLGLLSTAELGLWLAEYGGGLIAEGPVWPRPGATRRGYHHGRSMSGNRHHSATRLRESGQRAHRLFGVSRHDSGVERPSTSTQRLPRQNRVVGANIFLL